MARKSARNLHKAFFWKQTLSIQRSVLKNSRTIKAKKSTRNLCKTSYLKQTLSAQRSVKKFAYNKGQKERSQLARTRAI